MPRDICGLDIIFSRQQADSLLATPFGLVIEGSVALQLAKKLCDPPLFSAGDELLMGSGDSGFLVGSPLTRKARSSRCWSRA
jgi:hypothetical protein